MTRPIKIGDIIQAEWHFPGAAKPTVIEMRVLHTPSDTGDMWYLEEVNGLTIHAVNPQCGYFIGMQLVEQYVDRD